MGEDGRPCIQATHGVVCPGALSLKGCDLIVNREEILILMGHFRCALKSVQEIPLHCFRRYEAANHRVFDQTVFEGIPGIGSFVRRAHIIVADAMRVRVIKAGQVSNQILAVAFQIREWVQLLVKDGWPQYVRDGHQFEIVIGLFPELRRLLDICT